MKVLETIVKLCLQFILTAVQSEAANKLNGNCTGPFVIQLNPVPCPQNSAPLALCIQKCIADTCCRAGGIRNKKCFLTRLPVPTLDFVKNVPEGIEVCPEGMYYDSLF